MSQEILPADARFRVRFLIAMTVVAALGACGILLLNAYLLDLHALSAEAHPLAAAKARGLVRLVLGSLTVAGGLFSAYLGWTSWRVLRSERFPPPGARVLNDTPIRRGRRARLYGASGLVMAVLILVLTVAVTHRASRLFEILLESSLKPTIFQPEPE